MPLHRVLASRFIPSIREAATQENLAVAFAGESQANRRYTAFARQADKEGYPQIAKLFRTASEAEALKAGKDIGRMDIYLCPFCGDIEFGSPPEECPICGAPASKYQKIG